MFLCWQEEFGGGQGADFSRPGDRDAINNRMTTESHYSSYRCLSSRSERVGINKWEWTPSSRPASTTTCTTCNLVHTVRPSPEMSDSDGDEDVSTWLPIPKLVGPPTAPPWFPTRPCEPRKSLLYGRGDNLVTRLVTNHLVPIRCDLCSSVTGPTFPSLLATRRKELSVVGEWGRWESLNNRRPIKNAKSTPFSHPPAQWWCPIHYDITVPECFLMFHEPHTTRVW